MIPYIDIGVGEPIVMIHGLGSRKEAWKSQYQLSNYYRLIIPDLRGHGESENIENLTLENYAKDIIELLDYLNIDKAHICGLSLGGLVVQEIYKQNRNKVKSLILCNTTSYIPYYVGNFAANLRIQDLNRYSDDEYIESVVKNSIYSADKKIIESAKEAFYINRITYPAAAKSAVGANYLYLLPYINKPVLIIGGSKDNVTPSMNARVIDCFTPNSKLEIFDVGHLSNIENKNKFNETLLNFIEGIKL